MIVIRNIKYIIHKGYELYLRGCNRLKQKNKKKIFFYPHGNCLYDDYDIFNGESSNVLCLLKNILQDKKFDDYELYVLYYHHDKLQSYLNYVHTNTKKKIHFIRFHDPNLT